MARVWLTYAWDDNRAGDVDFVASELSSATLEVRRDRWNIHAGKRLWEQIAREISDAHGCDAWLLYATPSSLGSEACREEMAYALDRALNARGEDFPIIAIFPDTVDNELIPPFVRVRLFVRLQDPDWRERVVAAAEHRAPKIPVRDSSPYVATPHPPGDHYSAVVEVRPRAGVWHPFAAGVPFEERQLVGMEVRSGPCGQPPPADWLVVSRGDGVSDDDQWHLIHGWDAASPTHSYYLYFRQIPSRFAFGQLNGLMYFYRTEGFGRTL